LYIYSIVFRKLGLDPRSGLAVAASLSATLKIQLFCLSLCLYPKKNLQEFLVNVLSAITGFIAQELTINIYKQIQQ
jgi:hypothetical protein